MFELPEFVTLTKQINETLQGKTVRVGKLGNSPHKFVWYNMSHEEFDGLIAGKVIGKARSRGKWLFVSIEPGYVLLLGECGGKLLHHPPGAKVPIKYHMYIEFEDGSFFTATTQMWGAMELYRKGKEQERQYVAGMKTTPIEPEFTFDYFHSLITEHAAGKKRSVKGLLTQDQIIPGRGNAIAQDILFKSRLHPRHPITDLNKTQERALYDAIITTVEQVIEGGGRYDEYDLYNNRGGYVRIMDRHAVNRPCPECGGGVEMIQYMGGACYLCSNCQK